MLNPFLLKNNNIFKASNAKLLIIDYRLYNILKI